MNMSLEECKNKCDEREGCLAIEYGRNYGGEGGREEGDCLLQGDTDSSNCNGANWNVDLYVKDCGMDYCFIVHPLIL